MSKDSKNRVSIITHDMKYIQGSNRVTEKLIMGKDIFDANGICLSKMYTGDGVIKCYDYRPDALGIVENTATYKNKRKVVDFLKKIPLYDTYLGNCWSVNKNMRLDKAAAMNAIKDGEPTECFIIQGFFVAYFYLKYRRDKFAKTVVILHTDKDPLEQVFLSKKKLIGTRYEKKLRGMFDFVLKNADAVVTICASETKYLKDMYDYSAVYIANGIEDVFTATDNKLSAENGKLNFAEVASVQYRKGQDILIDAVSLLDEDKRNKIKIHIIGYGQDYEKIKHEIAEAKLDDVFIMHGSVRNISELLSKMDVFILPTRADTMPIAIIEALRAGLPVIASGMGEIPVMIDNSGLIIQPEPKSVANSIISFLNGDADIELLGKNARQNFENNYTLGVMIDNYSKLINDICERKN